MNSLPRHTRRVSERGIGREWERSRKRQPIKPKPLYPYVLVFSPSLPPSPPLRSSPLRATPPPPPSPCFPTPPNDPSPHHTHTLSLSLSLSLSVSLFLALALYYVLCYAVLCCAVLCCAVLCCAVLRRAVVCCSLARQRRLFHRLSFAKPLSAGLAAVCREKEHASAIPKN
jgi:hypothetical protein